MRTKFRDYSSNIYLLITLTFTVIIEMMGNFLILPILPVLFITNDSIFFDPNVPSFLRHIYYTICLSMWSIGALFGAPFLGSLSDYVGRKKVLVFCLTSIGLSYIIGAVSIMFHSIWLFFIGRLLCGFFCGSYDIVQAIIANISLPEEKAKIWV